MHTLNHITHQPVSGAVLTMKRNRIPPCKSTNQRPQFIGVTPVEGVVFHQCANTLDAILRGACRLNRQPLIHNQGFVMPLGIEGIKHFSALILRGIRCYPAQRREAIC